MRVVGTIMMEMRLGIRSGIKVRAKIGTRATRGRKPRKTLSQIDRGITGVTLTVVH